LDAKDILKFCLENGLLVDQEILNLFSESDDLSAIKFMLEKIKSQTHTNIITRDTFNRNREKVIQVFSNLPKSSQENLERLKIKLGLSIEILKEQINLNQSKKIQSDLKKTSFNVALNSSVQFSNKKIEVVDFVKHFRNRFSDLRTLLQEHSELKNLVSINKISKSTQSVSIIGLISEKKLTKNKNIIFEVEDLTGKINVLINQNKPEIYKKAEDVTLDSVIGFTGSGSREILFANNLVLPDAAVHNRKKSSIEEYALFIGDLHYGSKFFLEKNFQKFIDYLNGNISNTPEVSKIKYLFIIGDLIAGIGVYPNQDKDLKMKDLEEQFIGLSNLLNQIRKDIAIIICPGNHDGVRIMEPQPLFDEKYAWSLYNLKNAIFIPNPSSVCISKSLGFEGINVLIYHGFSYPFYADNISSLRISKAINNPTEIMTCLLKMRHLAPTHASTQYFPAEKDALFIREVPDIFVSAHLHKSGVSYYNNILLISTSCWESLTPYQEKLSSEPDHCKVPMLNLKTGQVKLLDFEDLKNDENK